MSELAEQSKQYPTDLDPLFDIPTSRMVGPVDNQSLEEMAATIRLNYALVIGPRQGAEPEMTYFERKYDEAKLLGTEIHPYGRIIAGDEQFDRKSTLAIGDRNCPELEAARTLAAISRLDSDLGQSLMQPMARELLVERSFTNKDDSTFISVNSPEQIKDMLGRLRAFAKNVVYEESEESEESDVHVPANVYEDLAQQIEEEWAGFEDQSKTVVEEQAGIRLAERPKETRIKRSLFRAAGAACLVIAGVSFYVLNGTNEVVPGKMRNRGATISRELEVNTATLDNLLHNTGVTVTTTDRRSVRLTQSLLFKQTDNEIAELAATAKDSKEKKYVKSLTGLSQEAQAAAADGSISIKESDVIFADSSNIMREAVADRRDTLIIEGMMLLLYGGFAILSLASASKAGGRLDKNMKTYRQGRITHNDATVSPAVNSKNGFGQRYRYTISDLSTKSV